MAMTNVTNPTVLDQRRSGLALDASYEVAGLVEMLLSLAKAEREESDHSLDLGWKMRGLSLRLRELNSVLMSVLGSDNVRKASDMEQTVYGEVQPQWAAD